MRDKPPVWIAGKIRSPPFGKAARVEAGVLLRRLQEGETLSLPHSRPLPSIGRRCQELRIQDRTVAWRILCRIDRDAILILEVFPKKSERMPATLMKICQRRLAAYDQTEHRP